MNPTDLERIARRHHSTTSKAHQTLIFYASRLEQFDWIVRLVASDHHDPKLKNLARKTLEDAHS